jgi:uncharacterized membrane protein
MSLAVASGPSVAAADPGPTPYPVNPLPVHFDVSPPLASMTPANYNFESVLGNDRGAKPVPKRPSAPTTGAPASPSAPSPSALATTANFDGLGQGYPGYTVCCAPPDTNASVGPNHIVETVNLDFVVFNKTGTALYGPVPINTLWSGFGGGCQINNDGDPTVLYDSIADRWLISQFSVTTTPYLNCVAVSTSPDPTGSYYRYSYTYGNVDFIDYPKFGIWPDAYYVTFNVFANGVTWAGAKVCAYDRTKILMGVAAAAQKCFQLGTLWGGLLPSTLNGATLPPAGSPNYVMALDAPVSSNVLQYWKFHVDFVTPANATFVGPTAITVATYKNSCSTSPRGDCIPQGGGGTNLESLADRLMYRLNYRNFGDHAALVVNHTIEVGSGSTLHSGVRWYEVRPDAAYNLALFQQGTYAPDANWRWMGSVNMDKSGNIAMGYSVSSSTISPQIHFTGRLAGDLLGTMGSQGENVIINGGGSQTGGLARWGDYSSTAMDPVDDCTFWHANEYLKASGSFNWSTRIASFKLPSCGSPDYSLSATPSSVTVTAGSPANYTVTVTPSGGFTGTVTFSASGLPASASASFAPTTVTTSGNSTMSVTTSTSTPAGSYPLTITGTSGTLSHATSVTLVVNAQPTPDYTLTASPASQSVSPGAGTTYTVTVTPTNGFAGTVNLTLNGLPSGATGSFAPSSLASGDSILTVSSGTAAAGTYTLTITGSNTGIPTHSTTVGFSIADYNLSVSPSSSTVSAGASTTYTVTVNRPGGFGGSVTFSISGLPAGATGSFNPASTTGTSSTLTVTTSATTPTGSFPFTVTGTSGTTRTATATLVVNPAPVGDFSLSASPSSLTVKQGTSGSYTITITRTGGFSGTVNFSVTGLPAGTTSTFVLNPNGTETLTVVPVRTTPTGSFNLTITGTSGTLTHSIPVTLVVTQGCFGGDGDC